jgi:hypothetical protein
VCQRACEDDRGEDWELHAPDHFRKKDFWCSRLGATF